MGVEILVATPGRLLDLLSSDRFERFEPKTVILDEADEMLNMGFLEDSQKILAYMPEKRQTLLFSATMPPAIKAIINNFLKNPVFIKSESMQRLNWISRKAII